MSHPSTTNTRTPFITGNTALRIPQREMFAELERWRSDPAPREVAIVLPVGCGKSGCIAIAPLALGANRALVVAPNLTITRQLVADHDPSNAQNFFSKTHVLAIDDIPEPVELRRNVSNLGDLEDADVVITNIQQIGSEDPDQLNQLAHNFFDLILFDEAHHNVAGSWQRLRDRFPSARIVNFSATPYRADGRRMAGDIIYSYPIVQAIEAGYVKRLKAVVLHPESLRYVRRDSGLEQEVSFAEVRKRGEEDAEFRRSIVTSTESLTAIVDASITALQKLRDDTGEKRLKIIASALNHEHCHQIVSAYSARGLRAAFVHARESATTNERVEKQLANHDLDVIVQVKKLGEGFDHPYLAVAAIFSIFANLSPFVQFIGRVMRVIEQDAPGHPLNQGVVVFHAGANVASRWEDFQSFSGADQEYFDRLLPTELVVLPNETHEFDPTFPTRRHDFGTIEQHDQVWLEEVDIADKRHTGDRSWGEKLREHGGAFLQKIRPMKSRERRALKKQLDDEIKRETGRLLRKHEIAADGHDLDKARIGRTNFVVIKSAIDVRANKKLKISTNSRNNADHVSLRTVINDLDDIVSEVEQETFDGEN